MKHYRQFVCRNETKRRICIVTFPQEDYSKWYIVQALFKLMNEYRFENISVTDVVNKAGVGRATFYRYFKRKEDVLVYYFERHTKEFVFSQRFYPRCREDYIKIVEKALNFFKNQIEPFRLIRRARLEYIYLDYLNKNFVLTFDNDFPDKNEYSPYIYAGMLFNLSMHWLDGGCEEPIDDLAQVIVDAIYFER